MLVLNSQLAINSLCFQNCVYIKGLATDDDTELEASISLTYWINDMHGVSLGYTHNAGEADYIGLQYLYLRVE